ncbi:MAG: hypothetical protein IPP71_23780 [Bacteroidetes bacterium]|nr:hypothetical protein [Bacteroidota bacterium]
MKRILLALLILTGFTVNAQISITQNEMPHSGDELYRTRANVNPFLNYGATGANFVWNFTNLTATTQDSAIYQTVASTNFVYALTYADIFFNPNRANHALTGVDIPFNNLLPITDPYTFYYRSASVYKKVGYGVGLAGIPVPIIYSNQDEVYSLPLNYGDVDSTFSSYNLSIPTLAYYGYDQSRLNDVDGWGVINTPSGSFDALRVKTQLYGKDTISIDSLSLGFVIDRPVVTEYKWLSTGIRVPVLQINTTEIFGIEIITDIFFYDLPRSLNVAPPLANVVCPGASVQIPYTATGAFNPGAIFSPANIFRAQLSDATGSFATPVNIGSVTSTVSGVINATIPANTPIGTGYRIRVIATNPAFTGNDNGFDISIGVGPSATATASGVTEFCAGGSVVLSAATDPAYTYQWLLNGTTISGATLSDFTALVGGSYTVEVSNACGNATSSPITVIVNDLPEHTFAQSSLLVCDGLAVTIISTNTTGQTSLAYQWYLDGNLLTGEVSSDITTVLPGNYTLQVTNTLTGCAYTTSAVSLVVDVLAEPIITASGSTTFCDGGSVNLEVPIAAGVTFQWYIDGTILNGAILETLTANLAGTYTVLATSANGCTAVSGTGVSVIVNLSPVVPTLSASGSTTFCLGGTVALSFTQEPNVTYQWQLNGVAISGATGAVYPVSDGGTYTVIATGVSGCTSVSAPGIDVIVNNPPPSPVITASGSTLFCEGGSVTLEVPLISGYSYQWTLANIDINGATSNQYTVTTNTGFYSVNVTDANGCSSPATISYQVTVNPLPAVPVITQSNDTLYVSGAGQFQWYLDGSAITGATGTFYVVTLNGNYTVTVSDSNACEKYISYFSCNKCWITGIHYHDGNYLSKSF